MVAARFARVRGVRGIFGWQGGTVEPLTAEAELVLTSVHAETEALASGFTPHTAAALVEAMLAVAAHGAGRGAVRRVGDGATGAPAPRTARLVRPPLTVITSHTPFAANVVGTVGAGRRLKREISPIAICDARRSLVCASRFASIG